MSLRKTNMVLLSVLVIVWVGLYYNRVAEGCGGFFCQAVPIDQAGEQIIFRQDGRRVTAVVLIQYVGDAEDFSWVVPVPGIPELSTGSDLVFAPLEAATRPQFILDQTGRPCPAFDFFPASPSFGGSADNDNAAAPGSPVEVLQQLSVGPFDIQIVTSDDANALATWLVENGYVLGDRGRELIEPYVVDGLNFVAVRLRKDQDVGDLQPLIMRYDSDVPMIPIQLTAVAAMPDMGVLVWILGSSRAVPLNYLHVTPNYTRLNWYSGTFNAYASYQGLITAAMNEAGGQGFATDYAGRALDYLSQLPQVRFYTDELVNLSQITDDATFIASLAGGFVFPQDQVTAILNRVLPLPEGNDDFIYQIPELLQTLVTPEQLASARTELLTELNDTVIKPLEETLDVLDDGQYLTRFYTTLSADEMTLDPTFSFNPDLGDQQLERRATLEDNCDSWKLTLGAGTGREGEVVIEGTGPAPFFSIAPTIDQDAVWRTETVSIAGPPRVVTQKQFPVARVGDVDVDVDGDGDGGGGGTLGPFLCGAGTAQCGPGTLGMLLVTSLSMRLMRGRRR